MFKALVRKTRIPCVQIQAPPPMITVRAERMLKELNYFWVGDFMEESRTFCRISLCVTPVALR